MKKEINIAWTRDFTLAWAEWWSTQMNPRLKEVIGAGVDSQLSYFNGQLLETWRPVEESKRFIEAVVNIDAKNGFFEEQKISRYVSLIGEIRRLISSAHKKNNFSDRAAFEEIKKLSREMYPWYTVSYLLPQEQWAGKLKEKYPKQAEEILSRLIEARKQSEGAIGELVEYWRAVASVQLSSRGVSVKYSGFVTFDEMGKMFDENFRAPDLKKLEARAVRYIFFQNKVDTDTTLRDFFEKNGFTHSETVMDTKINEFKGVLACKGNPSIRGIVQIIFRNDEVRNFNQGNILVTVMTNPYFVPAMKKAAAVVTDEGGITCHAAIVARELNIPCIIGTKIATKVLRDGMTVEVDANKGIVKIIK